MHDVKRFWEYLRAAHIDARLWLRGKSDPELPPLRHRYAGPGDFRAVGRDLTNLLIEVGGLQPSHSVLDIGCGSGRVAIPLTAYLSDSATYDGFDVTKGKIKWCTRNITRKHPNFRFHHVEVFNAFYYERGRSAAVFEFPFRDSMFDFAFATSVFTHLLPDEIAQYLSEAHRVLKRGGRLLATVFALPEDPSAVLPHEYDFPFTAAGGNARVLNIETPAAGVAIDTRVLNDMVTRIGFSEYSLYRGSWSGLNSAKSFQDVVVAQRR